MLCFICIFTNTLSAYSKNDNILDSDERLTKNLISLRGEVEDLQAELKIIKSEHKNSMSYLNTRKTELQANIDRKELYIKKTENELEKLQEKVKLLGAGSEQLIPEVANLLNIVRNTLDHGIPFKQAERLSVIDEIERKLISRKITSQNAINRIWAFIEDEIRLTRENSVYSQTIQLNGENVLVEVAKLGTVMMYFKTRDDQYGVAKKKDSLWSYNLLTETNEVQQIATLFDSLKKQIRQGYFTLPLDVTTAE